MSQYLSVAYLTTLQLAVKEAAYQHGYYSIVIRFLVNEANVKIKSRRVEKRLEMDPEGERKCSRTHVIPQR
jgi:hypothetical protein